MHKIEDVRRGEGRTATSMFMSHGSMANVNIHGINERRKRTAMNKMEKEREKKENLRSEASARAPAQLCYTSYYSVVVHSTSWSDIVLCTLNREPTPTPRERKGPRVEYLCCLLVPIIVRVHRYL